MSENRNIGGEFAIKHNLLVCSKLNGGGYSSGRSALYYILLDIRERFNVTTVMVPDYLCSSILSAVNKAGFNYEFYHLTDTLVLDDEVFSNQYDKSKAVLVINYYGLQTLEQQFSFIKSLDENAIIIEDDVQAYYEFIQDSTIPDYKFTSLRKTFDSPDGGLVKTKYNITHPQTPNTFHKYKAASGILKEFRNKGFYNDDIYLELSHRGESMIDSEIELGISDVAYSVIDNTDVSKVSSIRKSNAEVICSGLKYIGINTVIPVADDKTPLFIPIYLEDRNKVRKAMFQHNIFCPVHWPLDGMPVKKGAEMAEHELSLIVDQRYTADDMNRILNILADNIQ